MAAVAAVFDTYELLENIMLRLPLVDTLTTTRVCSTWRTVFERSTQIRRLLFESDLRGWDTNVDATLANVHEEDPWILRTGAFISRKHQTVRLFIYSTLQERYTILCPQKTTTPLVSSGLRFDVSPVGVNSETGWVIEWGTSDRSFWAIHRVDWSSSSDAMVLERCLETFYDGGRGDHFWLSRRNGARIELGLLDAVYQWHNDTVFFGDGS